MREVYGPCAAYIDLTANPGDVDDVTPATAPTAALLEKYSWDKSAERLLQILENKTLPAAFNPKTAGNVLHPEFSVQRPVLQRLGQMRRVQYLAAVEIGHGPGNAQNAVIGAGAVASRSNALRRIFSAAGVMRQ